MPLPVNSSDAIGANGSVVKSKTLIVVVGTVAATFYAVSTALSELDTVARWPMVAFVIAAPLSLWVAAFRARSFETKDTIMVAAQTVSIAMMFVVDFMARAQ